MAKKNTKTTAVAETSKPVVATLEPVANGVALSIDLPGLLASIRAADSFDSAVAVLAPPTPKADATYVVNEQCTAPLPQKRGASVRVYVAAARLNRPFTAADVIAALPDVKGAKFWVARLAKTGHFVTE